MADDAWFFKSVLSVETVAFLCCSYNGVRVGVR